MTQIKRESKVYGELWYKPGVMPEFPKQCPVCGSGYTEKHDTGSSLDAYIKYACGGGYSFKPQIQNHTDKWWGMCGEFYDDEG